MGFLWLHLQGGKLCLKKLVIQFMNQEYVQMYELCGRELAESTSIEFLSLGAARVHPSLNQGYPRLAVR